MNARSDDDAIDWHCQPPPPTAHPSSTSFHASSSSFQGSVSALSRFPWPLSSHQVVGSEGAATVEVSFSKIFNDAHRVEASGGLQRNHRLAFGAS